jgi:hypothetical protein
LLVGHEESALLERDLLGGASTLGPGAPPGVIDQDLTHGSCRASNKVGMVLPVDLRLAEQTQIHLMNESSRLQRVVDALLPHVVARQPTQLSVDPLQQLVPRLWIAGPGLPK